MKEQTIENARRLSLRIDIDAELTVVAQALMHSSHVNEELSSGRKGVESNDRLEFLGDAVLDLYLAETLYTRYRLSEGDMSRIRAFLANEDFLAELARELDIGEFIMLGKGEAASGGKDRDSILADAFEAIVAALYLSKGFNAVRVFLDRHYSKHISEAVNSGVQRDFKTLLQEKTQTGGGPRPQYELVDVIGPPEKRLFKVQAFLGGRVLGNGEGHSKKAAEQQAAKKALENIEEPSP